MLVALFSERESHAVYFLQLQDMTRLDAVNFISHGIAKSPGKTPPRQEKASSQETPEQEEKGSRRGQDALSNYCVNLNKKAQSGKIDPLIGRESEIERTIQILCRRTKNNPLYVGAFTAIPIALEGDRGYAFSSEDLRREIQGRGLSALLMSNPCNPTGKLVQGEEMARWVHAARDLECSLLVDEFYSHYIWSARPARCRSRAPRATSRTSTRIRSSSSTGSPRTGATQAGAARGRSVPSR